MVPSVLEPKDLDVSLTARRDRPLSMAALTLLKEPIRLELRRQLHLTMSPATRRPAPDRPRVVVLREAFVHLFGANHRVSEYRDFVLVAAPLMRELLLEETGSIQVTGSDATTLGASLRRLERLAPRQARMIDLLYFSGVNVSEAAELLGLTEPALLRDLRFIKAWLAHTRRHDPHNENASAKTRR